MPPQFDEPTTSHPRTDDPDRTRSGRPGPRSAGRSGDARERLLGAAVRVFGQHGLDGASTRMLAEEANVNLQAIAYYFGHKEGLYSASAQQVAESLAALTAASRQAITDRLKHLEQHGEHISPEEARALLEQVVQDMAAAFIDDRIQALTQFMNREQMAPTKTFTVLYDVLIGPLLDTMAKLIACVLAEPESSERARLRALSLLGSVMVFRVAHAGSMAQLGWDTITAHRQEAMRRHVSSLIDEIGRTSDWALGSATRIQRSR